MLCCVAGKHGLTRVYVELDDDSFVLVQIVASSCGGKPKLLCDSLAWLNCSLVLEHRQVPEIKPPALIERCVQNLSATAGAATHRAIEQKDFVGLCKAVQLEYGVQIALGFPQLPLLNEWAKLWLPEVGALYFFGEPGAALAVTAQSKNLMRIL